MINGNNSRVAQVKVLSSFAEQQVASVAAVVVVVEELLEIRRSFTCVDDDDNENAEMPTTDCAPLANLSSFALNKPKRTATEWKTKKKRMSSSSSISAFLLELTLLASITIICLHLNSKAATAAVAVATNVVVVADAANAETQQNESKLALQPVIINEMIHKPIRAIRSPNQLQQLQVPVKLVQWTREAVQYHEGSTLVLSCSLATSLPVGNKLKFSWFKAAKPIGTNGVGTSAAGRLSIETLPDYSFLRLIDLRPSDSGAYTCAASTGNQEDRTTTQVVVNVKLKWLTPPSGGAQANQTGVGNQHELHIVRAGQQVTFECSAAAQPTPRIRWFRLLPVSVVGSGFLKQVAQASMSKQLQRNNNNNHHTHHHHQQQQQQQQQLPGRLEEAQIRAHLLQMEALGEQPTNQLYRIELGTAKGPLEQNALDEWTMRSGWRLETSGGSSQHEIHSRLLLDKADANQQGLFECEVVASPSSTVTTTAAAAAVATSGALPSSSSSSSAASGSASAVDLLLPDLNEQQQQTGDKLRKLFGLLVNGK